MLQNVSARACVVSISVFSRPDSSSSSIVSRFSSASSSFTTSFLLSFFQLSILPGPGGRCLRTACSDFIGARRRTCCINLGEAAQEDSQSHAEVWLSEGVSTAAVGGARSGSAPRLISRCHSATVGSRREGAAKAAHRTRLTLSGEREKQQTQIKKRVGKKIVTENKVDNENRAVELLRENRGRASDSRTATLTKRR